jgi:membrane carboxypeptidase/penicillin-binding protein
MPAFSRMAAWTTWGDPEPASPMWAGPRARGASTITMQVARNVYLSAEKSYTRKIYEILLTFSWSICSPKTRSLRSI